MKKRITTNQYKVPLDLSFLPTDCIAHTWAALLGGTDKKTIALNGQSVANGRGVWAAMHIKKSNDMLRNKQLLVVGGTGRDVGKTEFVCKLIDKFSEYKPVYALKVSAIFPDEELYHGTHVDDEGHLYLFEETRLTTNKDTSRMLRAGARRVFYLRSNNEGIRSGFDDFLKIVPEKVAIVCESNSLGQFVAPALSIMVKSLDGPIKQRSIGHLDSADLVIVSDGSSGFPDLKLISYSEQDGWQMQSKPMQDYD